MHSRYIYIYINKVVCASCRNVAFSVFGPFVQGERKKGKGSMLAVCRYELAEMKRNSKATDTEQQVGSGKDPILSQTHSPT